MPDGSIQAHHMPPGAAIRLAGGEAAPSLPLSPGSMVDAEVIADLGEGRYTIELRLPSSSGSSESGAASDEKTGASGSPAATAGEAVPSAAGEGGDGAAGEGRSTRLVVRSDIKLSVGESMRFQVQAEGDHLVLTPAPLSTLPATAAAEHAALPVELTLPLDPALLAATGEGGSGKELVLRATPEGRVEVVGPDGRSLPITELLAAGESSGARIEARLLEILSSLPSGSRLTLTVARSEILQPLSVAIRFPEGETIPPPGASAPAASFQTQGEIRLSSGALPHAEALEILLAPGGTLEATVAASRPGFIRIETERGLMEVALPPKTAVPPGSSVALEAEAPLLRLHGWLTARQAAPEGGATPTAGSGTEPRAAALDTLIRAAGLNPSEPLRLAAEALRAEHAPIERATLQIVLAAAREAQNAPSAPPLADLVRAAAHLFRNEIPLAPALVRGAALASAAASAPETSWNAILRQTVTAIAEAESAMTGSAPSATTPAPRPEELLAQARNLLESLPIPLEEPGTPAGLARFSRTLATPALEAAAAALADAAERILAASPGLTRLDLLLQAAGRFAATRGVVLLPDFSGSTAAPLTAAEAEAVEGLLRLPLDGSLPERAEAVLGRIRPENLARAVQALREAEAVMLRAEPALQRLAVAHESVSSLIDRAAAYKAQSLAGQQNEPAYYAAEVPVRFRGAPESGSLTVYCRRGREGAGKRKPWSSRVVLDLQTTRLGPVLGDLRFSPSRLDIVFASADEDASGALSREEKSLRDALIEKGFNPKLEFRVVTPETEEIPAPAPSLPPREREENAGGRLDIQI